MAIRPLTRVQQATVLALLEARRLDAVPVDASRAASFMAKSTSSEKTSAGHGPAENASARRVGPTSAIVGNVTIAHSVGALILTRP